MDGDVFVVSCLEKMEFFPHKYSQSQQKNRLIDSRRKKRIEQNNSLLIEDITYGTRMARITKVCFMFRYNVQYNYY